MRAAAAVLLLLVLSGCGTAARLPSDEGVAVIVQLPSCLFFCRASLQFHDVTNVPALPPSVSHGTKEPNK